MKNLVFGIALILGFVFVADVDARPRHVRNRVVVEERVVVAQPSFFVGNGFTSVQTAGYGNFTNFGFVQTNEAFFGQPIFVNQFGVRHFYDGNVFIRLP